MCTCVECQGIVGVYLCEVPRDCGFVCEWSSYFHCKSQLINRTGTLTINYAKLVSAYA